MGIFTSSRRRAEQATLAQGQANANRLRMFLPIMAAGLDSEGYSYAQRAIGMLVAVAGWPSLATFVYQFGFVEYEVAKLATEDAGELMDRTIATIAARLLLKAYTEPVTLADLRDIKTVACMLMVWWGLTAEPQRPVVCLMQQFGGHPFKTDNVQEIERRLGQIRSRITSEAQKLWKQAEQEMSAYASGLPAA